MPPVQIEHFKIEQLNIIIQIKIYTLVSEISYKNLTSIYSIGTFLS